MLNAECQMLPSNDCMSTKYRLTIFRMIPSLAFLPPVIAHRGASAVAPENTLAAIRATREQGANWVELDVKITYDGVPVLMHDETLNRTTSGSGFVAEVTWSDVSKLDAGISFGSSFKGEGIPHLSEAVNTLLFNSLSLMLEIKPCPGRAKATTMVAIIELAKVWPEGDFYPVISSFDMESLQIAAQLEPQWPRCLILEDWTDEWREKMAQSVASALTIDERVLTRDRVEEMKSLRLPLLAYTVDEPERAKELLDWGVSAVYSNHPRVILEKL